MLDLVLPVQCGGCGSPGTRWCAVCAGALTVAEDAPHLVIPRHDPQVPVFALGRYAGPRRAALVALKEHHRTDLIAPLARTLAVGLQRLTTWGVLTLPLTVVPAPTRWLAARRRGGDPVARLAARAVAGHPGVSVVAALRMRGLARDSVGLSSAGREHNVTGRVVLARGGPRRLALGTGPPAGRRAEVVLVDDIVTTGATARESVRVLESAGVTVSAVLTLAHA